MSMENLVSTLVDFDMKSGLSRSRKTLQRHLSEMKGMFANEAAYEDQPKKEDILVYEFFDRSVPNSEKEVAYGTSITYPGKISLACTGALAAINSEWQRLLWTIPVRVFKWRAWLPVNCFG